MKQVIPGRDPDTCAEQLAETLYYSNIFACPKVPNLLPSSGAAVASVASSGPGKKAADASSGSHKKKVQVFTEKVCCQGSSGSSGEGQGSSGSKLLDFRFNMQPLVASLFLVAMPFAPSNVLARAINHTVQGGEYKM